VPVCATAAAAAGFLNNSPLSTVFFYFFLSQNEFSVTAGRGISGSSNRAANICTHHMHRPLKATEFIVLFSRTLMSAKKKENFKE
jgi:hypothetical protein